MAAHDTDQQDAPTGDRAVALSSRRGKRARGTKPTAKKSPIRQALSFIVEVLLAVLVALVITALLRVFVFQVFRVPSGSMEQTLELKDRIAAVRVADWGRGDIVVFKDAHDWVGPQKASTNPIVRALELLKLLPDSTQGYLVKRVIGMPGDHVACCNQNGQLTVNGQALDESSYLYRQDDGTGVKPSEMDFDVVVPVGNIFVMGDHRNRSGDSRLHLCQPSAGGAPPGAAAFIPVDEVVGPVKAIVMPLGRIKSFHTPATFNSVPAPAQQAPEVAVISAGTCAR